MTSTHAGPGGGSIARPEGGSIVFDRAAGYYDATRGLPPEASEAVADRVEAALGPTVRGRRRRAARLLEVGVGTGRIALPLHRRGHRVIGVDLSLAMMAEYRRKAAAAGLAAPPLVRADVTRLPFRDASVDAVVEVHVLHLVPGWRRALDELRRVLVPGGTVLVGRGGGHAEDETSPRNVVSRRMGELAGGPPHVGARDDGEKLEALAALGGVAEPLEPVRWVGEETWGDALAEVEGRCYSHAWRVPEDVWLEQAARLRAEVEAEHPDLDEPVSFPSTFQLTAVRF